MSTQSSKRQKFTPEEIAKRAENREMGRFLLEQGGSKIFDKKRKYKKKATRRKSAGYSRGGGGGGGRSIVTYPNVIGGLGAYTAPKSARFGENLGRFAGSMLPGLWGALSGLLGKGGGWLGNKIGTVLGLGEYDLQQNSIINEGQSPAMMHSEDDTIFVRHREYLGDIISSATPGAFKVEHYPIQPGLDTVFEWLAPIATQYQEWIPNGILFEFKSNSGDQVATSNTAIGQVIMSTDYNAYNLDPFTNKAQMQNTMYSTNAKITESFYHPIECAPHRNVMDRLFVRAGQVPPGQPPQMYDLGTFAIASVGCSAPAANLGELWVTYEIGLAKASLIQTAAAAVQNDYFAAYLPDPYLALQPFRGMTEGNDNSLGCFRDATGTTLFFPPLLEQGTYMIDFYVQWSQVSANTFNQGFAATNCSIRPFWGPLGTEVYQLQGQTPSQEAGNRFIIDIFANNAKITCNVISTPPASGTHYTQMMITRLNQDIKPIFENP